MRFARPAAASAVIIILSALAACGGGGGGGTVTPPGGGNNPTPVVTSTPTPCASPCITPSPTPTPSAGPTATPTTAPTSTPTTAPTATPTTAPTSTPSGSPTSNPTTTVQTGYGEVNGADNQFISSAPNQHGNGGEGDLMANDPGALSQGGGQGPVGAGYVDNIPCQASMSNDYHVHAFVGIFINGQEVALPDAIGIVDPFGEFTVTNPDGSQEPNQEIYGDCFYYVHTHDASGLVHLEAPSSFTGQPPCGAQASPPYSTYCTQSYFTLGNLLDIWGISISANNFGQYTGQVGVYGTTGYAVCPPGPCYTGSKNYVAFTDPSKWSAISLYHLTTLWIVVGPQPTQPSSLPNVEWIAGGGS